MTWASLTNHLLLCDSKGAILDSYCDITRNPHPRLFELLGEIISKTEFVQSLFFIPPDSLRRRDLEELTFPNTARVQQTLPGRVDIYSRVPLFFCSFKRIDGDRLLCRIRLATFFRRIVSESWVYGLFCVDSQERLQCFNLLFASAFSHRGSRPETLLGRSLRDLLAPTPMQAQQEWREKLVLPDPASFETVFSSDPADADTQTIPGSADLRFETPESPGRYFPLPVKLDWLSQDFLLQMETDPDSEQPPCLTILDAENDFPDCADREHLLIGPHDSTPGFLLKRRGDLLHFEKTDQAPLRGGTFRFYRIGNGFAVVRDGQRIFSFLIHEDAIRGRAELALFIRPGTRCVLRKLTLAVRPGQTGRRIRNLIASVTGRENIFLLLSTHLRFQPPGSAEPLLAYRFHDLSDVRGELLALKEGYDASLRREKDMSRLLRELKEDSDAWVGESRAARTASEQAMRLAKSGVTLLITGPTGAGKEVLARRIHAESEFRRGPFVKVDCSTLPHTLMESLLFGHEKGAFTGATEKRKGLFEQAQGGTLFLDEIGNLTLEVQSKLLQFLQDFSFTAVGGDRQRRLHLRVIAATNAALDRKIKKGEFREDLYYRLAVGLLRLPSLRERAEDIPALSDHFVELFNLKHGKKIEGLTPGALRILSAHPWPGNIRELKNVIERAHLFCTGRALDETLIEFSESQGTAVDRPAARPGARKPHVHLKGGTETAREALRACGGVVSKAARRLNISRPALYLFLSKNGIRPSEFRPPGQRDQRKSETAA